MIDGEMREVRTMAEAEALVAEWAAYCAQVHHELTDEIHWLKLDLRIAQAEIALLESRLRRAQPPVKQRASVFDE